MSASNFKNASEALKNSDDNQSGDLPICYLQRHSIELYLKSLIYILHKKFDIPFGQHFSLEKPAILANGKWKLLSNIHNLSDLFSYFLSVFDSEQVSMPASTNWTIDPKIKTKINLISGYDPNSTYFRYPKALDAKRDAIKSDIQTMDFESAIEQINSPDGAPVKCVLMLDDNYNIVETYDLVAESLSDVKKALDETIEFMDCIHSAFLGELTKWS
ncbi:hypothetical protein [Moritella viscosa]|uniref:hypothetical protein n=1 Tax=Moritella viscosa TaxID=80854 RepID=UPI0015B8D6F4|nr:hypothetical protein [Moritella viscosa]